MLNPMIKSIAKTYDLIEEDVEREWNEIKEELSISDDRAGASVILNTFKKRLRERGEGLYTSQFTEAKDIVKFNSEQKKRLLKYCTVKVGSLFHQAILKTGATPEQESKLLEEVIEKFIKEEPMEGFSMKKSDAKPEKEEKKKDKGDDKEEPLSEEVESFFSGSFEKTYKRIFE